jgi:hypothetical protein
MPHCCFDFQKGDCDAITINKHPLNEFSRGGTNPNYRGTDVHFRLLEIQKPNLSYVRTRRFPFMQKKAPLQENQGRQNHLQ